MSLFRVRLTQGNSRTGDGSLDYVAQKKGVVTAATNASPIVITSVGHGLVTGQRVMLAGVGGNTAANSTFTVTVVDVDHFALNGSVGNGSYTSGGNWSAVSVQRTIYVDGPNLVKRELNDGQLFTDCNYWKQFAYPQISIDQAFIEVVTDDGIPFDYNSQTSIPKVYSLTVANGTGFATNVRDILGTFGVAANSASVSVTGANVVMRINNDPGADYPIVSGGSVEFSSGEVQISSLAFSNLVSGGSTATVLILFTLPSKCNT